MTARQFLEAALPHLPPAKIVGPYYDGAAFPIALLAFDDDPDRAIRFSVEGENKELAFTEVWIGRTRMTVTAELIADTECLGPILAKNILHARQRYLEYLAKP
jgi:hypothetical protein